MLEYLGQYAAINLYIKRGQQIDWEPEEFKFQGHTIKYKEVVMRYAKVLDPKWRYLEVPITITQKTVPPPPKDEYSMLRELGYYTKAEWQQFRDLSW